MIQLMLIDDDKLATLIATKMLNRLSDKFEISVYLNALSALNALKAQKEHPDAILLDINMPQIDGWSFLGELNKIDIFTDVIMLTSSIYDEDMEKAKTYPQVKGFFQKPLNRDKILKLQQYYSRP